MRIAILAGVCGLAASAIAQPVEPVLIDDIQIGDLIYTEIFYATNQGPSSEGVQEFVEIFNRLDVPVDASGGGLFDNFAQPDGNQGTSPFPDGTIIEPRSALVVIGNLNDPPDLDDIGTNVTPEIFEAAWGTGINFVLLADTLNLSNGPSPTNRDLAVIDTTGRQIDTVNYDDEFPWPSDSPQGFSIVLRPDAVDGVDLDGDGFLELTATEANDIGFSWIRSDSPGAVGTTMPLSDVFVNLVTGVVNTDGSDPNDFLVFPQDNIASPGFVDTNDIFNDCNNNGLDDEDEIILGLADDLDGDGSPDICTGEDCDDNGVVDSFQIAQDFGNLDCDLNGVPDICQIDDQPALDSNGNGRIDICEVGDILITEIMFNPNVDEPEGEYVEIYNNGTSPVNVAGWTIGDLEPGNGPGGFEDVGGPIVEDITLAPGEAAVIILDFNVGFPASDPDDPFFGNDPAAEFAAGWGTGFPVAAIADFSFRANNAAPLDEVLTVLAPPALTGNTVPADFPATVNFVAVDTVDYDADFNPVNPVTNPELWPGEAAGLSLYLRADSFDNLENNLGGSWELSIDGVNGARSSTGEGLLWDSVRNWGSPGNAGIVAPGQSGEVIITEIHNAPNTPTIETGAIDPVTGEVIEDFIVNEFVEIWNTTDAPIDVSGWFLQDEDGITTGLPAGSVLQPGESAIIFGVDEFVAGSDDVGFDIPFAYASFGDAQFQFQSAWGGGFQVFPVRGWNFFLNDEPDLQPINGDNDSLGNLSNGPGIANEILTLRRADGSLVDLVNWDDEPSRLGDWPNDSAGDPLLNAFSLFLFDTALDATANDNGANWAGTILGTDPEARTNNVTDFFSVDPANAPQVASPGQVAGGPAPDLGNLLYGEPCSRFDITAPFGEISFGEVTLFVSAFNGTAWPRLADVNDDLVISFGDVTAFISGFNAGCP